MNLRRQEVFHNPIVRRMVGARTAAALGTGMLPVALSFTVLSTLHSAEDLGLILGSESVSVVASIFFAGILGDRFQRKALVISSDIVISAARITMALGAMTHFVSVWLFVGCELSAGVAKAIFFPSFEGWFQATIPEHLRQQATSLRSVYWNLGNIIGPAIAGALAALWKPSLALLVSGLLPLFAVFTFRKVDAGRFDHTLHRQRVFEDIRDGWNAFRSMTWVWTIDIQFALWHILVWAPLVVLGPIISLRSYHGAATWALVWGSFAVGGIFGGVLTFRSKSKYPLRAGLISMVLTVLLLGGLAMDVSVPYLMVAAVISGVGNEYFSAIWGVLMQTHVPAEVMSKVTSFDVLASSGLLPLGYALVVPISHLIGTAGVLNLGSIYLVVSVVAVLSLGAVRNLPRRLPTTSV